MINEGLEPERANKELANDLAMAFRIKKVACEYETQRKKYISEAKERQKAVNLLEKKKKLKDIEAITGLSQRQILELRYEYIVSQILNGVHPRDIVNKLNISYSVYKKARNLYITREIIKGISKNDLAERLKVQPEVIEHRKYTYVIEALEKKESVDDVAKQVGCSKNIITDIYILHEIKKNTDVKSLAVQFNCSEKKILNTRNRYAITQIEKGVPPEIVLNEWKIDLKTAPEVREACVIYELKKNENRLNHYLQSSRSTFHHENNEDVLFLKKFGTAKEELRTILTNYIDRKKQSGQSLTTIGQDFGFVVNEQGKFVYNETLKKVNNFFDRKKIFTSLKKGGENSRKRPAETNDQPFSNKKRLESIVQNAQKKSEDCCLFTTVKKQKINETVR